VKRAPQPGGTPADDLIAVVGIHLAPAHDLARRLGCTPEQALAVVSRSALDLVDVVAAIPETVPDRVGWWMARTRVLADDARAPRRGPEPAPAGGGVLGSDDSQQLLAGALERLDEPRRVALLLRDAYGLPAATVAAALFAGTGEDRDGAAALEVVAEARLALLSLVDGEPVPENAGHVPLAALARLDEDGKRNPRDAAARRHAATCASCRALADAQGRACLLLLGLALAGLDEDAHAEVLATVTERAGVLLPPGPPAGHRSERWPVSPLMAVTGVVLALAAGVGVGLLLSRDAGPVTLVQADGSLPPGTRLLSPSPAPSTRPTTVASVAPSPPQTSVFVYSSPAPPRRPERPAPATAVTLTPTSGPNGTSVQVRGSGFTAGASVRLAYLDAQGRATGSEAEATADAGGAFTAEIAAQDPAGQPGAHEVRARAGGRTATATFTVEP